MAAELSEQQRQDADLGELDEEGQDAQQPQHFDDHQQQYQHYDDGQHQQQQQQYDDGGPMGDSFMRLNLNGQALPAHDGAFLSDPDDGFAPADAAASSSSFPVFKTGECVVRSRASVMCARCDLGNGHCYLGSSSGELVLFDFNSQREVWRRQILLQGKPMQITCIDVSSSHTKLAIGGSAGETVIYDLEQFAVSACFMDHKQRVSAVAWVGNDSAQVLYTTSHDGYFLVRDVRGKVLHSFITCSCPLSAMQVESPGVVYLGSWDGQVKKLDLERKMVTLVLKANTLKESPIRCFALAPSPPGAKKKKGADDLPVYVLIVSHGIGEIKSWDMRTGKVYVEAYQGCGDVVNALCVWNGKLYAAGDDRSVRIFDVHTGQSLESLSGHENGVTGVCIVGVTPVVTQEMLDAAEAAIAALSSRAARSAATKAAREAKDNPQQGVGNELLITTGFDCQARGYKVAAIDAAIQLRLLRMDEHKTQAFEAFVAAKKAAKSKGSRKGSAKGKKGKGSNKKKKDGAETAAASKTASGAASAAGSKAGTARGTGDAAAAAASPDATTKPASAGKPKSAKKKKAAAT